MSVFTALAAQHLAPAFAHYADEFFHRPMSVADNVNARPVPDVGRPSTTLQGVYFDPAAASRQAAKFDMHLDRVPGQGVSLAPRIEFHPAALGDVIFRAGDLLERPSDSAVFRIIKPWRNPTGIAVVEVNKVS